jgi:hypothetical protein
MYCGFWTVLSRQCNDVAFHQFNRTCSRRHCALSSARAIPGRWSKHFWLGCLRLRMCLLRGAPDRPVFPTSYPNESIVQILTGKVPFHELPNDMKVLFGVAAGKRPSRPISCSGTPVLDSLWELLQNCWDGEPEMRPTTGQIVDRLVGPTIRATTTSSKTDWDDTFTSKFRRSIQAQPLLPSVMQIESILFGAGQLYFSQSVSVL